MFFATRPWNRLGLIRQKLCHHYQVKAKTKKILQVHFEFAYFYFVLIHMYSFGIETINTSIHVRSRSSHENHTRFQTKMGKVFSDQKRQKNPTLWAVHTYMAYIREYPRVLTPFIVRDRDQV